MSEWERGVLIDKKEDKILTCLKEWKRESWHGVHGLGYIDIECKHTKSESESERLNSNILEKERDDEILT